MTVVFQQVLLLFLFVITGYILCKIHIVNGQQAGILSSLLVYLFFPCKVFRTFAQELTLNFLRENWQIPLLAFLVTAICAVVMHYAAKILTKDKYAQSICEYSLVVPNYAYMGYALTESLLGPAGLVGYMLFSLPVTVYIYTVGFNLLTKRGFHIKKLLNPVTAALVLGLCFMLTGLRLPSLLSAALEKASACLAPVSMLLTGIVIAGFPVCDILKNKTVYLVTLGRLLLLPLAIGGILQLFCGPDIVSVAVLLYALPCGLNTVVFPRLIGEDCRLGAGLAAVSCLASCLTIPVICTIFQIGGF